MKNLKLYTIIICNFFFVSLCAKKVFTKQKKVHIETVDTIKPQQFEPIQKKGANISVEVNNYSDILDSLLSNSILVKGGTFVMGATEEQNRYSSDDEKPAHEVTLKDFIIGRFEITQKIWKIVMNGENPSYFKGENNPVENISYDDILLFFDRLKELTNKQFRLPTEAEWEYAARQGKNNNSQRFSGDNDIEKIAWYKKNSSNKTHQVGEKKCNSLGIYDLSGNVSEWCSDFISSYSSQPQHSPTGPNKGYQHIVRGGNFDSEKSQCRTSARDFNSQSFSSPKLGFRIVIEPESLSPIELAKLFAYTTEDEQEQNNTNFVKINSDTLFRKQIIDSLYLNLVLVHGGLFKMGADKTTDEDADIDESPIHKVKISDFYISKYEITQSLWYAVMDNNPSENKGWSLPVENVSFEDICDFLEKIKAITGLKYRLPTEAEWEYSAKGGCESDGYIFSGSNNIEEIAWYDKNSNGHSHPVGCKRPNELGIYDLTGNVAEWCSDRMGKFTESDKTNPNGPIFGTKRIRKGGGWFSSKKYCRNTGRYQASPNHKTNDLGFRLVLEVDNYNKSNKQKL